MPNAAYAQKDTTKQLPDGTDGRLFTPRVADTTFVRKKTDLAPNEFEGEYSTFRIGLGFIGDYTAYSYDKTFRKQMDSLDLNLTPAYKTRDFRILASGRFLKFKRYVAWKFAYMYDGDKNVWMVRESGLTIGIPELKGNIFIGRTKEGFSMIKVMNGHSGITNERQMALDPVPILADGIKYFGYYPRSRTFLNLAAYSDLTSRGQAFSTFNWQFVGRGGWVPVNDDKTGTLLHIALEARYGSPVGGKFTIKSRPESNPTPQLINTGTFSADGSTTLGGEIYYRNNRFMIGSEAMVHNFYSKTADDHHFFGGDAIVSFFLTDTKRPYNTTGNVFGFVPVRKSVFQGGLGAIEAVLHVSTFNLNDGVIQGGQMTRITPMINWYLSKILRWELVYGYGILNRFGVTGHVNFFETRIQITMM
ncbi:MAG: porin [Bacteroidetes bacterium]|nr:MAG: porin [Bacteroidota bacterium]